MNERKEHPIEEKKKGKEPLHKIQTAEGWKRAALKKKKEQKGTSSTES